jgi:hypothetical protein
MSFPHAVRKRIEDSALPKIKKREELSGSRQHHHHHRHSVKARPWQIGHSL